MTATSQGFQIEGNAIHLARHLTDTHIDELVSWSCLLDDVKIELSGISFRISLRELRDTGRLHFHAIHDGPGKDRTWSRRVQSGASSKDLVALIVSDVRAIRREFRLLEPPTAALGPAAV
ncbi:hypothetical protein [Streptomyces sp. cmx-4-9]|uniref:hypothetical protein n=1 Tax=Streptomyces sp. cmx-4-9 TaxID=2790941 RepID=UPI00397F3F66